MPQLKTYTFDDGSSITWIDRETLRYSENDFDTKIWVDFEPGLFNSGRIIKASSIITWNKHPLGTPKSISKKQREMIIEKIKLYYDAFNKKCRVEN